MSVEIFRGEDIRWLIPFSEEETQLSDGSSSVDEKPKEAQKGFDDTHRVSDGSDPKVSQNQEGGRAHGKSRLEINEEIFSKAKAEAADDKLTQSLRVLRDDLKIIAQEKVQEAQKAKAKLGKKRTYTIHPVVQQKPRETEREVVIGSAAEYQLLLTSVRKEMSFIKNKLLNLVNDQQYARWHSGDRRGRRLDRKMLPRIPLGEDKIFRTKVESQVRDVAFSLLIDESGSMSGEKTKQARRCAVMFGEILSALKVPFEIIGYTSCGLTQQQRVDAHRTNGSSKEYYNRTDNLQHNMYKRFHEDYVQSKCKLVKINASGGNFDQDHVEFAWERLKKRPEVRKVLIVISDGQPCGGEEAREKLKRVINEIGCDPNAEVIGIGIQTAYVKDFYHACVEISDVSQLGRNVIRLIEHAFFKRPVVRGYK